MPTAPVVILTQEEPDNARLAELLARSGLRSISYPCIATESIAFDPAEPVDGRPLSDFRLVAFTSKRGAGGLMPARHVISASSPLIACIGEATAQAVMENLGLACDIMPPVDKTGAGLAAEIIRRSAKPEPLLHVRGDKTTGTLKQGLEDNGWQVSELVVYRNYAPAIQPLPSPEHILGVFASPSAAENFFAVNEQLRASLPAIAIGPVTGDYLRSIGLADVRESPQPDPESVAATVAAYIRENSAHEH